MPNIGAHCSIFRKSDVLRTLFSQSLRARTLRLINVEFNAPQQTGSGRIRKGFRRSFMKSKFIAALLVAASASLAAPAFASGLGPAPFYRPDVGAPSSQRGPSVESFAADQNSAAMTRSDVGGAAAGTAESSQRSSSGANDAAIKQLDRGQ
jgi:hypothetical protein